MNNQHAQRFEYCPHCGEATPEGSIVCASCRTALLTARNRVRPPAWVIALLVLVIIGLATYAAMLIWRVLVLHDY